MYQYSGNKKDKKDKKKKGAKNGRMVSMKKSGRSKKR